MTYRVCRRCVMDTSDREIQFDERGYCNHCRTHEERAHAAPFGGKDAEVRLARAVDQVRRARSGAYDCIVGLSGGVDSSYVSHLAVNLGLRPLAVHFDNGWNAELAVRNIETMVTKLKIDLQTFVIDWEEFRDIQRAFFAADVIDIEMVTDHAIFAAMFSIARKMRIRYILSGTNVATESIMPASWQHLKSDLRNLKAIHRRFGSTKLRNFPMLGVFGMGWNHYVRGFKTISPLNFVSYRKDRAMELLRKELGWQYYGGKHYESVFTKFYQAHILPVKFGVDKRRAHLSDLIMNGEMTRDAAVSELQEPLYEQGDLERDRHYVCKKLGFTIAEFEEYLRRMPVSHYAYPSYARFARRFVDLHRKLRYR